MFAVAYLILLSLSWLLIAATEGFAWLRAADVFDAAASGLGGAGLCAFAFAKPMGQLAFWRAWALAQPAWDLLYALVLTPLGFAGDIPGSPPETNAERALTLAIVFGLQVPVWLALYRYGYRCEPLWSRAGQRH